MKKRFRYFLARLLGLAHWNCLYCQDWYGRPFKEWRFADLKHWPEPINWVDVDP